MCYTLMPVVYYLTLMSCWCWQVLTNLKLFALLNLGCVMIISQTRKSQYLVFNYFVGIETDTVVVY